MAKTAYGLNRVMACLQKTAVCVIGAVLLLSNLSRALGAIPALFYLLFLAIVFPQLRGRA